MRQKMIQLALMVVMVVVQMAGIARANIAPTAVINSAGSTIPVYIGETAVFAGSGVDNDGSIVAYQWAFPAGAMNVQGELESKATCKFRRPGSFTIQLRVCDNQGAWSNWVSTSVSIADPTPSGTSIWYVAKNGSDWNHGRDSSHAFGNIQTAIQVAQNKTSTLEGDTVLVEEGIFNENINFLGKNITVKSSNPTDWSVVENTIIKPGGFGPAVQLARGETSASLQGITVTGGKAVEPYLNQVAYWPFDVNGQDSAGQNHGTLTGVAITNTAGTYKIGTGGLQLNGNTNDLFYCGDHPGIRNLSTFSISLWFKANNTLTSGDRLICNQTDTNNMIWNLQLSENQGMRINGGVATNGTAASSYSSITISANQWYHVVMTYDDSTDRKVHLYVNGMESYYGTQIPATGIQNINAAIPVIIGNRQAGDCPFKGFIDEVQIFNRLLSGTEIAQMASIGGLVSRWKLDTDGQDSLSQNPASFVNGADITHAPGEYQVGYGSIKLDGTDDYLNCGTNSSLTNLSSFSVSLWMKADEVPATRTMHLMGQRDASNHIWSLQVWGSEGGHITGFVGGSGNVNALTETLVTPEIGRWYHVTMTYDDSGDRKVHIYIDGVEPGVDQQTAITGTRLNSTTIPVTTGDRIGGGRTFKGVIDDVSIYNSVLPPAEIIRQAQYPDQYPLPDGAMAEIAADDQLLSYWNLNENGLDSVGQNNGTLTNGAAITGTAGEYQVGSGGLKLDGVDDLVNCGNGTSINNLSTFSVSMWFRLNSAISAGQYPHLICQRDLSNNIWTLFMSGDNSGRMAAKLYGNPTTNYALSESTFTPVPGQWYHVVMTYDDAGERKLRIMVNGLELSYTTQTALTGTKLTNTAVPVIIGNRLGGDRPFNGFIDDVRIYNRKLSILAASNQYKLTGGSNYINRNLSGYWNFESDTQGYCAGYKWDDINQTYVDDSTKNATIVEDSSTGFTLLPSLTTEYGNAGHFWYSGTEKYYLSIPDSDDLTPATGLTLTSWFKLEGANIHIHKYSSCPSSTIGRSYSLYICRDGITWTVYDQNLASHNLSYSGRINVSATSDPATWYYLTATFDKGMMRIYLDGELKAQTTVPVTQLVNDQNPLIINSFYNYCSQSYTPSPGSWYIDEFRVFSRPLNSDEIKLVMNRKEKVNGGGIYCQGGSPSITNCIIKDNQSHDNGGGVYSEYGNPLLKNCLVVENSAGGYGGGIMQLYRGITVPDSVPQLTNLTISNNTAHYGGGLATVAGGNAAVINSIIWGNTATYGEDYGDSLYNVESDPNLSYTDVEGGINSDQCGGDDVLNGSGNLSLDPLYAGATSGDYHLSEPNSPAIDAGNPSDLYGNEPTPNGSRINLGAYGNTVEAARTYDTDGDGLSNPLEVRIGTNPISADSDQDGMPDGWEYQNGLDPLDAEDAGLDQDNDGLTNTQEYNLGFNPDSPDTDGDTIPDKWEYDHDLNGINADDALYDNDQDGLTNVQEYQYNTDPLQNDSDCDNLPDGWEVIYSLNPINPTDYNDDGDGDGFNNIMEYLHNSEPNMVDMSLTPGIVAVPQKILSVQNAVNWSISGDIIEISYGNYNEDVNYQGKAIAIRSIESGNWNIVQNTVITGDITFGTAETALSRLEGITVKGTVTVASNASPIIQWCQLVRTDDAAVTVSSGSPTIHNNKIMGNSNGDGIQVTGIEATASIKNNWIYQLDNGIELSDCNDVVIWNNTIVDNTQGIVVTEATPDIRNCILWDNASDDLSNCSASYSCIQRSTDASGAGNITGDSNNPQFMDASQADYRINRYSPCKNAGDPGIIATNDLDITGQPRQVDSDSVAMRIDMGADEVCEVYNVTTDTWYETIQGAINAADSVTVNEIRIYEWVFDEIIVIWEKAIILTGTHPEEWSSIKNTVISPLWYYSGLPGIINCLGEVSATTIKGLTLQEGYCGIYCANNASPVIQQCSITANRVGIQIDSGSPVIERNKIIGNGGWNGAGIISYSSQAPTIKANWVCDNDNGIILEDATDALIYNNTVANNTQTSGQGVGIQASYYAVEPTISNNIIWKNDDDLINCAAVYSCLTDPNDVGDTSTTKNVGEDPQFIAEGNYACQADSPTLHTADPTIILPSDSGVNGGALRQLTAKDNFDANMGADPVVHYLFVTGEATGLEIYNAEPQTYDQTPWQKPYKYLQDALSEADKNDIIYVAKGTYTPASSVSNIKSLMIPPGVKIYGGFTGLEAVFDPTFNLNERQYANNQTILCSKAGSWGQPILYANAITEAVINGFTITDNVNAKKTVTGSGPALVMDDSSNVTLQNCVLRDFKESAVQCNSQSSLTVDNCQFYDNLITNNIGMGAAIYLNDVFTLTITNSQFKNNNVGMAGGAIAGYCVTANIQDTLFENNSARLGGAVNIGASDNNIIMRSYFYKNYGYMGGAIYSGSKTEIYNSVFADNLCHNPPTFWGIPDYSRPDLSCKGGAIYAGDLQIINCTLFRNSSELEQVWNNDEQRYQYQESSPGGGLYTNSKNTTITNSILWQNKRCKWDSGKDEYVIFDSTKNTQIITDGFSSTALKITYSYIQGWTKDTKGNYGDELDPLFKTNYPAVDYVDGSDGRWGTYDDSLRLQDVLNINKKVSPCIDAGDPASDYSQEPAPNGSRIDMGAFGNTPYAAGTYDSDSDGLSDRLENLIGTEPDDDDSDGDLMPDGWEYENDLDPKNSEDAYGDLDSDGISNIDEYNNGSNPGGGVRIWRSGECISSKYKTIQAAIDAARSNDEIVIPNKKFSETINIKQNNITLRSTNPDNPIIVAKTILTLPEKITGSVISFTGGYTNQTIKGITITGGNANDGGGIYCKDSSPTISKCVITKNYATSKGGGIYLSNSSPRLADCQISKNSSGTNGWGGGIYLEGGSAPEIVGCIIEGNTAANGAGIYNNSCNMKLINSQVRINLTNTGGCGGGIYNYAAANTIDSASSVYTNCLFQNNEAAYGGGIYNKGASTYTASPALINCTLVGNNATATGGGIYDGVNAASTLTNTILWGNTNMGVVSKVAQILSSFATVSYSCIQDGRPGGEVPFGNETNIDTDPQYMRIPNGGIDGWFDKAETGTVDESENNDYGDLALSLESGCIDCGNNGVVVETTDLAGNARIQDGNTIVNGITVDMGAYEKNDITNMAIISGRPDKLLFKCRKADSSCYPAFDTIYLTNTGGALLNWTVSSNCTWLVIVPTSGSTQQESLISVSIDTTLLSILSAGNYNATITISSNAENGMVSIPVEMKLYNNSTNTYQVDDEASLLSALTDAAPHDEIILANGGYRIDESICINKSLTIRSASNDPEKVMIHAEDLDTYGYILTIGDSVGNVNIRNITVMNPFSGGGIFCGDSSSVSLTGCRIVYSAGSGIQTNGLLTLDHCLVAKNKASNGGGIYLGEQAQLKANNCTIANNRATISGGGIYCVNYKTRVSLENSILWGNTAATPAESVERKQIYGGDADLKYCCIQGWTGWMTGEECIPNDPYFVSTSNYHLQSAAGHYAGNNNWVLDASFSPCIDAGDPAASCQQEPQGNGRRINLGFYGGTSQASKTTVAEDTTGQLIANDDKMLIVGKDKMVSIDVLKNDYHTLGKPFQLITNTLGSPQHGVIKKKQPYGVIFYQPALNYYGKDTIEYNIETSDELQAASATIEFTIASQPRLNDKTITTGPGMLAISEDITAGYINEDGPIHVVRWSQPGHGKVKFHPTHPLFKDGSGNPTVRNIFVYQPQESYHGPDSFSFIVESDNGVQSRPVMVQIQIDETFIDTDHDTISDADESRLGMNLGVANQDNDDMPEGWEVLQGTNPTIDDKGADPDGDGKTNQNECTDNEDPVNKDTDKDSLSDEEEEALGTDPANADSDGDGLSDGQEVYFYNTNPKNNDMLFDGAHEWYVDYEVATGGTDSDGDGIRNSVELAIGTNPNVKDSDGDGFWDGWEYRYSYNPLDGSNPAKDDDSDGDGLVLQGEYDNKTSPLLYDTDGGGVADGSELIEKAEKKKTDPLNSGDDYLGFVVPQEEIENTVDVTLSPLGFCYRWNYPYHSMWGSYHDEFWSRIATTYPIWWSTVVNYFGCNNPWEELWNYDSWYWNDVDSRRLALEFKYYDYTIQIGDITINGTTNGTWPNHTIKLKPDVTYPVTITYTAPAEENTWVAGDSHEWTEDNVGKKFTEYSSKQYLWGESQGVYSYERVIDGHAKTNYAKSIFPILFWNRDRWGWNNGFSWVTQGEVNDDGLYTYTNTFTDPYVDRQVSKTHEEEWNNWDWWFEVIPSINTVSMSGNYEKCKSQSKYSTYQFSDGEGFQTEIGDIIFAQPSKPVDIDIDSDNNNAYNAPARSELEDYIECPDELKMEMKIYGKYIRANTNNDDNDGILDYLDGYNYNNIANDSDDQTTNEKFVPLVIELPEISNVLGGIDYTTGYLKFEYADNLPTVTGVPLQPEHKGELRIWKKDGSTPRGGYKSETDTGDFIASGVKYYLCNLGFNTGSRTKTFYLEGIKPSTTPGQKLKVILVAKGSGGVISSDAVIVTVVAPQSGIYESVTGVTPSSGRSLPVAGMDVYAEVLMHNRQLKVTHTDFAVPGRMLAFSAGQTYRSGSDTTGSDCLANGWYASWDEHFTWSNSNKCFIYTGPDGRQDEFKAAINGQTIAFLSVPTGYACKVEYKDSSQSGYDVSAVVLTYTNGSVATYTNNANGSEATSDVKYVLRNFKDRYDNEIQYNYDTNIPLRLVSVTDDMNRVYNFVYQSDKINYIAENTSTQLPGFKYVYNISNNKLNSIVMQNGSTSLTTVNYDYNTTRGYLVSANVGGGNNYFTATYDTGGVAVNKMVWGAGAEVCELFKPDAALPNVLRHTDTNGVITEYLFGITPDKAMLCYSSTTDPDKRRLMTSYDYNGEHRLSKIRYPMGNYTEYVYMSGSGQDKRGTANISQVTQSAGNRPIPSGGVENNCTADFVIDYSYYPEANYYQLQNVSSGGITYSTYDYYNEGNYHYCDEYVLNQSGGWDLTQSLFNLQGKLLRGLDPAGGLTVYGYYTNGYLNSITKSSYGNHTIGDTLTSSNSITSTITDVTPYGQPMLMANPQGAVSENVYDAYFRISEKHGPVIATINGTQYREHTTYTHNPVLSRLDSVTYDNPVATSPTSYNYTTTTTSYDYDGLDRLLSTRTEVQGIDQVTSYCYEINHERLASVCYPNGSCNHILYDSLGRPEILVYNDYLPYIYDSSWIFKPAHAERMVYNNNGELIQIRRKYGTDNGDSLSSPVGFLETSIGRDWAGRPAQVFDEIQGRVTQNCWNGYGLLTQSVLSDGATLLSNNCYEYYNNGDFRTGIDNITGVTVQQDQDYSNGRWINNVSVNGGVMSAQTILDGLGRPEESSNSISGISSFVRHRYNENGMLLKSAPGSTSSAAATRLDNTDTPYNVFTSAAKLVQNMIPELSDIGTTYKPSGSGAPGVVQDPAARVFKNTLDEMGSIQQTTGDAGTGTLNCTTQYNRDDPYRTQSVTRNNQSTDYQYDLAGNLLWTIYNYNSEYEGKDSYYYDSMGRLIQMDAKNGTTLKYHYYDRTKSLPHDRDHLYRIYDQWGLLREYSNYNVFGKPEVLTEYNPNHCGDIVVVQHQYGQEHGSDFGQLIAETTTIYDSQKKNILAGPFTVEYYYDSYGRRLEMTYPSGLGLKYNYQPTTANGVISNNYITTKDGVLVYGYDLDSEFKNLKTEKFYNGIQVNLGYDSNFLGLVGSMKYQIGTDPEQQYSDFNYNTRGLKSQTSQWDMTGPRNYDYDGLGRLAMVTPTQGSGDKFGDEATNLDLFENMTSPFIDNRPIFYSQSNNKISTFIDAEYIASLGGTASLPPYSTGYQQCIYDLIEQGGLTSSDSHYNYRWDAFHRLVSATDLTFVAGASDTPQAVYYLYDALGRRVANLYSHHGAGWADKVVIYDGLAPIEERYYTGDPAVTPNGLRRRIVFADQINKPVLVENYQNTILVNQLVPLCDDRGTVMGVVDVSLGSPDAGRVKEKLYYNSTGLCKSFEYNAGTGQYNPVYRSDYTEFLGRSSYVPFGWCGMIRDEFTGKYHTHFRDYDPVHSRWLSEDPAGYADGLNLYAAYMGVNGVDVLGLQYDGCHPSAWLPETRERVAQLKQITAEQMVRDARRWQRDFSGGVNCLKEEGIAGSHKILTEAAAVPYAARIMMHHGVNGGNLDEAFRSATGWQMVGCDVSGLSEASYVVDMVHGAPSYDLNYGYELSFGEQIKRTALGSIQCAGNVMLVGSAVHGIYGPLAANSSAASASALESVSLYAGQDIGAAGIAIGDTTGVMANTGSGALRNISLATGQTSVKIASYTTNEDIFEVVYRGVTEPPEEVFRNGFVARGKSLNLAYHAHDNQTPPSAYVGSSRIFKVAKNYSFDTYVYAVRARNGLDVNLALGPHDYFDQMEVAIPWKVHTSDILGCTPVDDCGNFLGYSILNPNFRP